MKNIKKLSLIAMLSAASLLSATDLHTGKQGKNYNSVVGPSLAKQAKKHGAHLTVVAGKGSQSNMDAVIGTGDFALAQANVSNPLINSVDKYSTLEVIGTLGMECAFPVVPTIEKNGIKRPAQLSSLAGEKITIGAEGSGDNFSFKQLKEENPELAEMKAIPRTTSSRYIGKVGNGYQGAAFFFSVPDKNNPLIKEVLTNPNVTFADAEEINLGSLGTGKRPALFKQDLTVGKQSFTAVCTNINVIADITKVDEDVANAVYQGSKTARTEALTASGAISAAKLEALKVGEKLLNFFK